MNLNIHNIGQKFSSSKVEMCYAFEMSVRAFACSIYALSLHSPSFAMHAKWMNEKKNGVEGKKGMLWINVTQVYSLFRQLPVRFFLLLRWLAGSVLFNI